MILCMHSQLHAERHPTIGSTWLHHRNSSGIWQMVCCCVRHCLSLTWTAIAPGSPEISCSQWNPFCIRRHRRGSTRIVSKAMTSGAGGSRDIQGWLTHVDSIWLHIWLLDSGVFAHKGSKGLPVRVTTRLSSWTKRTNDPSTPMCCLECFGGDWQFNYI